MISMMEEYLQYMKTLRSQMNDVEDQAAKVSAEEQMLITTIESTEKDIVSAKSKTKQLKEDAEKMSKEKGQICAQILEKQRKIASLESDSSTLAQTLELIQQERVSLSKNLVEIRSYYAKVAEDINAKLQQQQDWVKVHWNGDKDEHKLVNDKMEEQRAGTEGKCGTDNHSFTNSVGNEARDTLMAKLVSAKAKLDGIAEMKSKLVLENGKINQSIEQVKCKANKFKPELLAMDIKTLNEEREALLSDNAGETEYLQSLENQIEQLKGISCLLKCDCGQEYKVDVSL